MPPPFTFVTVSHTITGIEQIALTTNFGFTGVSLPGGELGGLLHLADLFGLVQPDHSTALAAGQGSELDQEHQFAVCCLNWLAT